MLDLCGLALQRRTQEAILLILFSSAQDDWVEVAGPARDWLLNWRSTPSSLETTEQLLLSLLADLPSALRRGDAIGQQHARQLTSVIQVRH